MKSLPGAFFYLSFRNNFLISEGVVRKGVITLLDSCELLIVLIDWLTKLIVG